MAKFDRSKPRLGRGLNSLLSVSDRASEGNALPVMLSVSPPVATEATAEALIPAKDQARTADLLASSDGNATADVSDTIQTLEIDQIQPNPYQPRRSFDEARIAELAASLKSTGLIQPVLVRQTAQGYQLIAGERRLRAAKLAGLKALPAVVRKVDPATQAQMALVENIQREDLNPLDRAQSYRALMDQLGLTQAELANRLGEERSGIANHLRLLNLVEPVREMIRAGRLTFGHAKLLAGVEDMLEQKRLADLTVSRELSVRELEKQLQSPTAQPSAKSANIPSPHIRDLEQSLSRQLGMRVQVRSRGKKGAGRLLIHYSSLDQFDELLTRLGTQTEPT